VAAASALGAPQRRIAFTVPTGNFGDVFAGYAALRMGVPIERLVIATNRNDILARTLASGRYETRGVTATISPSMDIEVSSNFERLLFDVDGHDGAAVRGQMASLAASGAFAIDPGPLARITEAFAAGSADEAATGAAMAATWARSGYLADPHTAVGLAVAAAHTAPPVPMVTLATAHPAKFPAAVTAATGVIPALPAHLADLMDRPERLAVLPNDRAAVTDFITARARGAATPTVRRATGTRGPRR
jgi:threonine synthase